MACISCNTANNLDCEHLCTSCAENLRINNNTLCQCTIPIDIRAAYEDLLDELYEYHETREELMSVEPIIDLSNY